MRGELSDKKMITRFSDCEYQSVEINEMTASDFCVNYESIETVNKIGKLIFQNPFLKTFIIFKL